VEPVDGVNAKLPVRDTFEQFRIVGFLLPGDHAQ